MEDGEVDFSNNEMFTNPDICNNDHFTDSLDAFLNTCTHTHTCNPPGPDSSHTHTCYHVHTKIMPPVSADGDTTAESSDKKGKKRSLGNRIAVQKYRDKKKALAASKEEEVASLRAENQQLKMRIQSLAGLEAEVVRLKCLLADVRVRIDGGIGTFPYQNQLPADPCGGVMNPCNMQHGDQVLHCLHPQVNGENVSIYDPVINGCEFDNMQCLGNQNSLLNEFPG